MSWWRTGLVMLGPICLVASHIVGTWAISFIDWIWLVRPLTIGIALAAVVAVAVFIVVRRPIPAALIADAIVLLFMGGTIASLAIAAGGLGATWLYWRRIRRQPVWKVDWAKIATVPAFVFAVIMTGIVVGGITRAAPNGPTSADGIAGPHSRELPSIYLLLLDSYPRADSLAQHFDYDNGPFIRALSERGFEVADDSQARFPLTDLTVLGMVSNPDSLPAERLTSRVDVRHRIASTPLNDELREAGYQLVYLPSPVLHTAMMRWDHVVTTEELTELEVLLVQTSPLAPVFGTWVIEGQRTFLTETLENFAEQADADRQQVVFAHLMAPHQPFIFGAGGSDAPMLDCWLARRCRLYQSDTNQSLQERSSAFVHQLEHLNGLVLDGVDKIVAEDPGAFVVVLSDHGSRLFDDAPDEKTRTLYAIRGPAPIEGPAGPELLLWRLWQAAAIETSLER